ncbi:MAG TPA: transcriptional repressor [Candidatus Deferrimicrobiaceae bacterium]|nr:transcriptional repressor [Candidatus Deferrimicrobiaceae bacterium]
MEKPSKKSRNTKQRAVILEILRNSGSHPTAEAIYQEARKVLPNISLGTVYRNLNFLREQGMAREIRTNSESCSRFEGRCPPHAHFHCTECQAVLDLPLPTCLKDLVWTTEREIASVNSLDLHVIGSCSHCGHTPS